MSKKYSYTAKERKAERELDRFLQTVRGNASSQSVLDDLRLLAAE